MITNIHQRSYQTSTDQLWALVEQVGDPGGPLWPTRWPPMVLDRPLGVGADGGHGPIRYQVVEYVPGRRAVFRFHPSAGVDGTHTFEVLDTGADATLRHVLTGRPRDLTTWLRWTLVIRWLHDALLEDLLDRAGRAVGDPPARPNRWSP